ncbi:MAG: hypothetical protein AXW14_16665 [Alteromonas sp. Nap_26]|nr:MAG: hypothetical protein AXW14_16665 [Alteromonas sp. Nap_26]
MNITLDKLIETLHLVRVDDETSYKLLTKLYGTNLSNLMNNLIAHSVEPMFIMSSDEEKDAARRLVVKAINIRLAGRAINTGKTHEPIV